MNCPYCNKEMVEMTTDFFDDCAMSQVVCPECGYVDIEEVSDDEAD